MSLKKLQESKESILNETKEVVMTLDVDSYNKAKKLAEKAATLNVSKVDIVSNTQSIMFTATDKKHAFKIINCCL